MNTEERLGKLNDALKQVVVEIAVTEANLRDLKDQELTIRGQIVEREFDNVTPDGGIQLPIFETAEELAGAMENRGKDVLGETEDEVLEQRQSVLEAEALRKVDWVNDSVD